METYFYEVGKTHLQAEGMDTSFLNETLDGTKVMVWEGAIKALPHNPFSCTECSPLGQRYNLAQMIARVTDPNIYKQSNS